METRSFTVLIVDDEEDVGTSLARALRLRGWKTTVATGGREALLALGEMDEGVDVVISDYDMPEMKGLDLLQKIRLRYPNTLRVLLTGRSDVRVASRALNEGAAHRFFLKPWNSIDLEGALALAVRTTFPLQTAQRE